METVLGLEPWLGYLIVAVLMTYALSMGGWALARAGRSPLWVLLLLVPWLNVLAVWLFAYVRWPALEPRRAAGVEDDDDGDAMRNG